MTKKTTKQPGRTTAAQPQAGKTASQQPSKKTAFKAYVKEHKLSIIVLAIAAVIFFAMLFWLYSDDILHGEQDIFDPYGKDEIVEFEKAKVLAIVSEDKRTDEVADNAYVGSQELSAIVKSGRYKGETMTVYNYFGPLYGVPEDIAREALRLAQHKLPIKTKIVSRADQAQEV